ncbi:MAG: hypothetical protein ACOCZ8_05215 [Bacteroidota bacterium]
MRGLKTNTFALDFAFVNAFKELTRRHNDLKARVEALEVEKQGLKATIDDQDARLKHLERLIGERAER